MLSFTHGLPWLFCPVAFNGEHLPNTFCLCKNEPANLKNDKAAHVEKSPASPLSHSGWLQDQHCPPSRAPSVPELEGLKLQQLIAHVQGRTGYRTDADHSASAGDGDRVVMVKKPWRLMSQDIFFKSPFSGDKGWRRGQNKKEGKEEKTQTNYRSLADSTKTNRAQKRTVIREWKFTWVYFPEELTIQFSKLSSQISWWMSMFYLGSLFLPNPQKHTKIESSDSFLLSGVFKGVGRVIPGEWAVRSRIFHHIRTLEMNVKG